MGKNKISKQEMIDFLIENYKPGKTEYTWKQIGDKFGFEAEQARKIWLNYRKKIEYGSKGEFDNEEVNMVYQPEKIFNNFQSDWKRIADVDKLINRNYKDDSCLVINLPDLHLDKRDLDNNTIDQNIDRYFEVLKYLVGRSYAATQVNKIVFVVGNDLFNTDNILDSTANGTIQRVNTTWDKAYEKIYDAMVQSIALLSKFCNNVHVVLIQGNHDKSKSYYMAHALEQYFRNDPSITFDRENKINKIVTWGSSFIGFNHGNNVNDKLPLAFAQEFYKEWGQAKYHDIYIGDKHHNNEKLFNKKQVQDERQGVRLRILPSLSKPDTWHDDNLYRSRQSGIALIYDKERGKICEWEYQV